MYIRMLRIRSGLRLSLHDVLYSLLVGQRLLPFGNDYYKCTHNPTQCNDHNQFPELGLPEEC